MKRMGKLFTAALTAVLAVFFVLQIPAVSAQAKTGESVVAASKKNGLKTERGKYYFYKNGKLVKKAFVTVRKKTYYFTKDGSAATGWLKIGKKAYYFDKNCVMAKNRKIDGIKLNKKGYVSFNNEKAKLKFKVLDVVSRQTKKSWSNAKKLKRCYQYVLKCTYLPRSISTAKRDWEVTYALDMLTGRKGNCYSYASSFAVLARECGYDAKIVMGMVSKNQGAKIPHAWVEIKGKVYDPQSQANMGINLYGKSYKSIRKIVYAPQKRI